MKKLTRLLALALMTSMSAGYADAREISESEALQRALQFNSSLTGARRAAPSRSAAVQLAYKSTTASDDAAYYVFDRGAGSGFIIVSADDRLPEVLGYTSSGNFDYDALPPNLRWWLGEYAREIESVLASDTQDIVMADSPVAQSADRQKIPVLLKSKWNQSAPYNNHCPEDGGGRSVTGCVATALSQIIRYHGHPATGVGTYEYTWKNTGQKLSYDYASTTFDWANMLDSYDSESPEAANEAVATLLHACGVGLAMNYSSGESGAYDMAVPRFLIENMDYDAGVRLVERFNYSTDDWEELIYSELASGRPVFYSGQSSTGGHAFVCDGYEGENYYHINWGWGGMYDGGFLLSALTPDGHGIGGHDGGYNSDHKAVIGIRPNAGTGLGANIYSKGTFEWSSDDVFALKDVFNFTYREVSVEFGIEVVPVSGNAETAYFSGTTITFPASNLTTGNTSGYSLFNFQAVPKGLAAGEYRVYPAFKTYTSRWERLRCQYGMQQYVSLTVDGNGGRTYVNPGREVISAITATAFKASGKVYRGYSSAFSISLRNDAEADYSSFVTVKFKKGDVDVYSARLDANVGSKRTFDGLYNLTLDVEPGEYAVDIYNDEDKKINDSPFSVTVEDGAPKLGVIVSSISPSKYYKGTTSTILIQLANTSSADISTSLNIKVYAQGSDTELSAQPIDAVTVQANSRLKYSIGGYSTGLSTAGVYDIVVCDGQGEPLCERMPIAFYEKVGNLWHGLTADGKSATITASPFDDYAASADGILDIPAEVTIGSGKYPVSEIENDAFAQCAAVSAVFLRGKSVPFADGSRVFGAMGSEVDFYVDGDDYDGYASAMSSMPNNIYAILTGISCEPVMRAAGDVEVGKEYDYAVRFTPAEHVNTAIDYECSDPELLTLNSEDAGGNTMLRVKAEKVGTGTVTITSRQPGTPVTASFAVNSTDTSTGLEDIDMAAVAITVNGREINISNVADGANVSLFDISGRLVDASVAQSATVTVTAPSSGVYLLSIGDKTHKVIIR